VDVRENTDWASQSTKISCVDVRENTDWVSQSTKISCVAVPERKHRLGEPEHKNQLCGCLRRQKRLIFFMDSGRGTNLELPPKTFKVLHVPLPGHKHISVGHIVVLCQLRAHVESNADATTALFKDLCMPYTP